MTREEAIATLEDIKETYRSDEDYADWVEACTYAINLIITVGVIQNDSLVIPQAYKGGDTE